MNIIEAKQLRSGQHLRHKRLTYQSRGRHNERLCVKVNGAPKTWKRNPERVQIPYKYGLYEYGYITERDIADWDLDTWDNAFLEGDK